MAFWKEALQSLDRRQPLPGLHVESAWDPTLSEDVLDCTPEELTGLTSAADEVVLATQAALLVWNDDMDAAHEIVQDLDTQEGSYWHGIIHRREGDYDNAKYWFARVGRHLIHESVYHQAMRLWPACVSWQSWNSSGFVDEVAKTVREDEENNGHAEALRRIQVVEFSFLLRHGLSHT